MITYLLKACACMALFYLVYLLFLRSTNRFQLNRAYLIIGLVLSFVVPAIVIPETSVVGHVTQRLYVPGDIQTAMTAEPSVTFNWYLFTQYLYFAGATIAFLISYVSIVKMILLHRYSPRISRNISIYPGIQPCSFFGMVFIPSPNEDDMVIEHEMVHIKDKHWIDLVLVEVAAIILWFNPIVYFYRKSVAIQHEYIADRAVVSKGTINDYLLCISRQLESNVLPGIVSHFNTRSIKQRIIMMTNPKSYSAIRYAIVIPVIVFLTMAFSTRLQNRELRWPVDASKLKEGTGTGFGTRINPTTQKEQFHTGVDFVLAAGNSVYTAGSGVVVEAGNDKAYGNFVVVMHDKTFTTSYGHLEKILVKEGERVNQGQTIGLVGSTGLSTGPHLHFEVLKDNKAVDPVPYLQ